VGGKKEKGTAVFSELFSGGVKVIPDVHMAEREISRESAQRRK